MWPFKLDVSRVSYPEAVRILVPFLPGAIIVTGIALLHSRLLPNFLGSGLLGYRTKLFVIGFSVYVAGILAFTVSDVLVTAVALTIGFATRRFLRFATFEQLSKDTLWRKAVKQFLGANLIPARLEPFSISIHEAKKLEIDKIGDVMERLSKITELMSETAAWNRSDWEWESIYRSLRTSFVRPNSQDLLSLYICSTFGAMGWAALIILCRLGSPPWSLLCFALLGILVGVLGAYSTYAIAGTFGIDLYNAAFTANLLREAQKIGLVVASCSDAERAQGF